jgi:hypothetical protein
VSRPLPAKALYQSVNRIQLDVVERLEAQFPDAPWHVIYEKVSEAHAPAAKHLPDLTTHTDVLEQHARALVGAATPTQRRPNKEDT